MSCNKLLRCINHVPHRYVQTAEITGINSANETVEKQSMKKKGRLKLKLKLNMKNLLLFIIVISVIKYTYAYTKSTLSVIKYSKS